jgi:hypothetical protein
MTGPETAMLNATRAIDEIKQGLLDFISGRLRALLNMCTYRVPPKI